MPPACSPSPSSSHRRLVEAIGAMDAYARKASPKADELVILGRAYLRTTGSYGGSFRAGELANRALKIDPKDGAAHLLLAELAAYAQCGTCAEESLANARAARVDEATAVSPVRARLSRAGTRRRSDTRPREATCAS